MGRPGERVRGGRRDTASTRAPHRLRRRAALHRPSLGTHTRALVALRPSLSGCGRRPCCADPRPIEGRSRRGGSGSAPTGDAPRARRSNRAHGARGGRCHARRARRPGSQPRKRAGADCDVEAAGRRVRDVAKGRAARSRSSTRSAGLRDGGDARSTERPRGSPRGERAPEAAADGGAAGASRR